MDNNFEVKKRTWNTDGVDISERKVVEINENRRVNFTVEPSNEKDYDILLMTGNSIKKGSD